MKNAKGIAVYMPSNFRLENGYADLDFSKANLWERHDQTIWLKGHGTPA